jgi:hypothetical protein
MSSSQTKPGIDGFESGAFLTVLPEAQAKTPLSAAQHSIAFETQRRAPSTCWERGLSDVMLGSSQSRDVSGFYSGTASKMTDEVERSRHDQIEVLSQNFPAGTEENPKQLSQDRQCSDRDSNRAPQITSLKGYRYVNLSGEEVG